MSVYISWPLVWQNLLLAVTLVDVVVLVAGVVVVVHASSAAAACCLHPFRSLHTSY